jgi:outer membrane protein assembly factor BamB
LKFGRAIAILKTSVPPNLNHEADWRMRILLHRFQMSLALGCALVCTSAGADWPRFRGANGTGVADDNRVPLSWNGKEGVLWRTAIPGVGNSSPIVWGDRLFLQSASEDGKERLLICVNVNDGKIAWTRQLPGNRARMHQKNTLASSTPATDGERVYLSLWDGADLTMAAYDFQGNLVWKKGLGTFTSQHGAGTSPMVWEKNVYLADDQDGTSTLYALDARSGAVTWKKDRPPFRACYSTPFILHSKAGSPELIVTSTAGITSYDPKTGNENWNWTWSFPGMPLRTVASAVHGGGLIIANSGDGSGERNTVAIRADGQGDVTERNLLWKTTRRDFPYVPSMLLAGGYLYFVNDQGRAACCNGKTGEVVWFESLGGNMSASPVLIDGKIYAANENGTVFVFAAAPTFKMLGKSSVGEMVIATPAVADNRLFIRGRTHLVCVGTPTDGRATQR